MVNTDVFKQIINDPIKTLNLLSSKQIVSVLEKADKAFFNTSTTLLSDDMYDIVKKYLQKKDANNPYLKKVGTEVQSNKEELPYYMGSLDKIKDSAGEIVKWQKKFPGKYVISEKLDGISCLLYIIKGEIKLLTRGNGLQGQNISHILPYLNINTQKVKEIDKIAIRGELVISRSNWNKISHVGANARNVVAGTVASKTLNKDIISHIDFVAYDVMFPRQKISTSLNYISDLDIPIVKNVLIEESSLNLDFLSSILQSWRKESIYEIDGIVIQHDEIHNVVSGKNPKYAFAFKTVLTQEQAEVIIHDVEWNVSKHRYLKPLVKFNEINLAGVKIKQATGFNAAYIYNNKIGPGSRIIIVRSGDVIPHIISVLTTSSSGFPKMPNVPYKWNDTNIDIMLDGVEKNREHDINAYVHFMKTLEVDGVKSGVIAKLYDAGFDTLSKIINISLEDIEKIDGFQSKSALKLFTALQGIKDKKNCFKLLIASNVFGRGFGEKKMKLILDKYPFVSYDKEKSKILTIDDIMKIPGIAQTTAQQFINGIDEFFNFCEKIGIDCEKTQPIKNKFQSKSHLSIFKNKKVVFSGFRDKDLEKDIEEHGGKIMTTISKLSDYLIIKDESEKSLKVKNALEFGIAILTRDEIKEI